MIRLYPSLVFVFLLPLISLSGTAECSSDYDWSGHLRMNGSVERYNSEHTLSEAAGKRYLTNGGLDGRLNGTVYFNRRLNFHAAYESVLTGGQTRNTIADFTSDNQTSGPLLEFISNIPSDDQQIFSLTKIVSETDAYVFYHRIDRLLLSYESSLGNLNVGRQALTWGNGLLFNPADLVNPFAPSDIIRDYKIGSDMILYQNGYETVQDLQAVIVPRRGDEGDISWDESTLGVKSRFLVSEKDVDIYILKNYDDHVLGAGIVSYVGDGILRTDLTWTHLDDDPDRDYYVSGIVNYDYSWVWGEKNWYGFLELYYNGLGSSSVYDASDNEALLERIERGEIFVTGRYYLNGMLQYEAHPLLNVFATLIYNLEDDSFLLQPRLSLDSTPDTQLLIGANIPVGSTNSEFGKLIDPESGLVAGNPVQLYLLFTYYF